MNTVAIIVPVLNEVEYLPRLLAHIREWGMDEIIFVDGGSSDETLQILKNADVKWIHSERGRAVQFNAGAVQSKSDILLFLHADTSLFSSHIEDIKRAMRNPSVAGGRFDVRLSGHHPAFRIIEFFINWRSRLTRISTGDQAMFVRREVFTRLDGFPEQPLMEDIEFSRRLKREGRIACLHRHVVTSSRRWEKHGIARTVLLMWWLRLRYSLGADPEVLKHRYVDCL
ncbi:MAG: TIGR04283 family arsenosugar biosynthesis glycosyltransferase [Zetaproteobacteria bacterium]|nr:MAG: TIGR04283 family arsenosugar biosynthesis glycosyltransferase [Zetaproteobacteria bacterium]